MLQLEEDFRCQFNGKNWHVQNCRHLQPKTSKAWTHHYCLQFLLSACTMLWVINQPNAAVRWPLFMETTSFVMQHISHGFMDWLKIKYRCILQHIPSAPWSWSEVDCAELFTEGSCRWITCVRTNFQMQVSIATITSKCSQNVKNAHLTQADSLTRALNEHLQNQSHLFCFILWNLSSFICELLELKP